MSQKILREENGSFFDVSPYLRKSGCLPKLPTWKASTAFAQKNAATTHDRMMPALTTHGWRAV